MSFTILTNNPLVEERLSERCAVELVDLSHLELLKLVRKRAHEGFKLLTHPLAGSVKPNETPYRSVLLSRKAGQPDAASVSMAEQSVLTCEKFGKPRFPEMSRQMREDFQLIDCSLIESALPSAESAQ